MIFYTIYVIKNILNNNLYCGRHITVNLHDGYLGSGSIIRKAIKKYGKHNFEKQIIFFAFTESDLIWAESHFVNQEWINRSDTYNIELGGLNGFHSGNDPTKYRIYRPHSDDTKRKMSESHKGKPKSTESSIKSGLSRRGKKRTPEQLKRLSDAHKGYKWSEERKKIYSKTQTGRSFSDSHRQSISKVAKTRSKCSCLFCHKEMPINNLYYHIRTNRQCLIIQQLKT